MWTLIQHKESKTATDLRVKSLLKEMKDSYAYNAESFKNHFKQLIKDIPKSNNFSADLMYEVTPRNQKSVEVWKMDSKGEFKDKLYTLNYSNC